MKIEKRKLKRFQSTADVMAAPGFGSSRLAAKAGALMASPRAARAEYSKERTGEDSAHRNEESGRRGREKRSPNMPHVQRHQSQNMLNLTRGQNQRSLGKSSQFKPDEAPTMVLPKHIRGVSSSSLVANYGEASEDDHHGNATEKSKLMRMRLKDSSNHLIVDKKLVLGQHGLRRSGTNVNNVNPGSERDKRAEFKKLIANELDVDKILHNDKLGEESKARALDKI